MLSGNHILIQDVGKDIIQFADKVPTFFGFKSKGSKTADAAPSVKPNATTSKAQPKLVDIATDRVMPVSEINRNKGRINIDYQLIMEALCTTDMEVVAKKYKVEQSHIHLIVQQGLRSLSLRFGQVAGRDLLLEPIRFKDFWIPIVEAYLYEAELFDGDSPENKILQLLSSLHKDKRHALIGKIHQLYNN